MKGWARWAVLIEWGGESQGLLVKEQAVDVSSVGVVDSCECFGMGRAELSQFSPTLTFPKKKCGAREAS